MPIAPAFLIKHARPLGFSAAESFFSPQFQTYLTTTLNMSQSDVSSLAQSWGSTALSDPGGDVQPFVDAANAVAQARWSELYATTYSTVLFVTAEQLVAISDAAGHAGANRAWVIDLSGDPIAIAVTIQRNNPGGATVTRNVTGISVATDTDGNLNHLAKIEP